MASRYCTKAEALHAFKLHAQPVVEQSTKVEENKQKLLKVMWVEYCSRLREEKVIGKESLRWRNPFVE